MLRGGAAKGEEGRAVKGEEREGAQVKGEGGGGTVKKRTADERITGQDYRQKLK